MDDILTDLKKSHTDRPPEGQKPLIGLIMDSTSVSFGMDTMIGMVYESRRLGLFFSLLRRNGFCYNVAEFLSLKPGGRFPC